MGRSIVPLPSARTRHAAWRIKGLVINRFSSTGIFVFGPGFGNRIEGNFVGTDPTGTLDKGNGFGGVDIEGDPVFGSPSQAVVGGTTPAARNLISGNAGGGVFLGGIFGGAQADSLRVQGNYVGTDRSGTKDLGNDGIGLDIESASNTTVGGTTSISRNSVFSNAGLGIDLVGPGEDFLTNLPTPNDADDPNTPQVDPDSDTGPNDLQNKPSVGSAKTSSTTTTVKGTLLSAPNQTFVVRFYANPAGGDEGKTFLGLTTTSTDGSGKASFAKALTKVAAGKTVTATATSLGGDTSEFSAPRTVVTA